MWLAGFGAVRSIGGCRRTRGLDHRAARKVDGDEPSGKCRVPDVPGLSDRLEQGRRERGGPVRPGLVVVVVAFAGWSGIVGFKMLREIADFDEWWDIRQAEMAGLVDSARGDEGDMPVSGSGEAC